MATRYYRNGIPGLSQTAYAQQQAASRQADIRARAEAAQLLAQQKADLEEARIAAQAEAEAQKRTAAFNALTTKTNADWNMMLAKQNKPSKIRVATKDEATGTTTTREFTPEEFAADKKAKEISDLTAKLDLLKNEWQMPFGLSRVPGQIAETEKQINALQAPADIVTEAASAVAPAAPARTPRGFIGSPGRNTFLAEPAPLGMSRAQTNEFAINLNNQQAPPPRDLLTSESFPAGYDPGHGSFQVGEAPAAAPVPQDAPPVPFKPIPKAHVAFLLANPNTVEQFNQKHGAGAAEEVLQAEMSKAESQP